VQLLKSSTGWLCEVLLCQLKYKVLVFFVALDPEIIPSSPALHPIWELCSQKKKLSSSMAQAILASWALLQMLASLQMAMS